MSVLEDKFLDLKNKNEKALVGFVTAGDPNPELSVEIVCAMADAGADIIEFGIPFSDPTADGPVIQKASARSIKSGTDINKVFEMTEKIKKRCDVPLVLFTYYNPVFTYGEEKFCKKALDCGANGILTVDLPFGEDSLVNDFDIKQFPKINLAAPTTEEERMEQISKNANGFIYLVSKTGVTGSSGLDPEKTKKDYLRIKKYTNTPVCVGFGIRTGKDVSDICSFADGAVIGSAFESLIDENLNNSLICEKIAEQTKEFKKFTKIKN